MSLSLPMVRSPQRQRAAQMPSAAAGVPKSLTGPDCSAADTSRHSWANRVKHRTRGLGGSKSLAKVKASTATQGRAGRGSEPSQKINRRAFA